MSLFLYLRRVLVRLQLFVGGPLQSHCKTPPLHKPAVTHRAPKMQGERIGQRGFAPFTEAGTPRAFSLRHPAVGTLRRIENLEPREHFFGSVTARSSKRNSPLVLAHA